MSLRNSRSGGAWKIVAIKCMIDLYKTLGETFCDNYFGKIILLQAFETCAKTYDLSKYEKCH